MHPVIDFLQQKHKLEVCTVDEESIHLNFPSVESRETEFDVVVLCDEEEDPCCVIFDVSVRLSDTTMFTEHNRKYLSWLKSLATSSDYELEQLDNSIHLIISGEYKDPDDRTAVGENLESILAHLLKVMHLIYSVMHINNPPAQAIERGYVPPKAFHLAALTLCGPLMGGNMH